MRIFRPKNWLKVILISITINLLIFRSFEDIFYSKIFSPKSVLAACDYLHTQKNPDSNSLTPGQRCGKECRRQREAKSAVMAVAGRRKISAGKSRLFEPSNSHKEPLRARTEI